MLDLSNKITNDERETNINIYQNKIDIYTNERKYISKLESYCVKYPNIWSYTVAHRLNAAPTGYYFYCNDSSLLQIKSHKSKISEDVKNIRSNNLKSKKE